MASIVTRKNSFAVVYMTTLNGVRKQKWETYHTLPEGRTPAESKCLIFNDKYSGLNGHYSRRVAS